ncbi:MAG: SRPBCC family protein [Nocardioidaceae bacterium]
MAEHAPLPRLGPGGVAVTVELDLPVSLAFAKATDWPGQGKWIPLTTVRVVRGDGHSVGSRIEAFTGVGRLGFLDVIEVTGWDPPTQVDVMHVGRFLRGPGAFEFRASPSGGTALTWSEWLDLPLGRIGRMLWPVLRPLATALLRIALHRLVALSGPGRR